MRWISRLFSKAKRTRNEARPDLERLDGRVVPATFGFGGMGAQAALFANNIGAYQGNGFSRFAGPGYGQYGFQGSSQNFGQQYAPTARPGVTVNPTSPRDFPYGPGGYFAIRNTPGGGQAGLMGIRPGARSYFARAAVTPSNGSVTTPMANPGGTSTPNPTSPGDFPYGPGGFFAIRNTPGGGQAGLMGFRRFR